MLMQLRMSADEAADKRQEKDRLFSSDLFELVKEIRNIENAVDAAALGDDDDLANIFDAVLAKYTVYKSARDRSVLVRKSKFMETCELTLRELTSENIRPALLVQKWGEIYANVLVMQNEREEGADPLRVKSEQLADAASANDKIPTVIPKGAEYAIANLSVVATARRTIQLKSLPPQYEAVKFANGYLLHKQKILALNLDDMSRKGKVKKIANVILALRAKGHQYINVLENRDPPYFHHKGNHLTFIWLMPVAEFSRTPLDIAQVQFLSQEDAAPVSNLEKMRVDREAFERFLAVDKQYAKLIEDSKVASAFRDVKAKKAALGLAEDRRNELLKLWKGQKQDVELPDSVKNNVVKKLPTPPQPLRVPKTRIGSRIGSKK